MNRQNELYKSVNSGGPFEDVDANMSQLVVVASVPLPMSQDVACEGVA
jgi:hypothetical protein